MKRKIIKRVIKQCQDRHGDDIDVELIRSIWLDGFSYGQKQAAIKNIASTKIQDQLNPM